MVNQSSEIVPVYVEVGFQNGSMIVFKKQSITKVQTNHKLTI
jgi:hypothetical protein